MAQSVGCRGGEGVAVSGRYPTPRQPHTRWSADLHVVRPRGRCRGVPGKTAAASSANGTTFEVNGGRGSRIHQNPANSAKSASGPAIRAGETREVKVLTQRREPGKIQFWPSHVKQSQGD